MWQPMLPIRHVRQQGRCIQFNVRQGTHTITANLADDLHWI